MPRETRRSRRNEIKRNLKETKEQLKDVQDQLHIAIARSNYLATLLEYYTGRSEDLEQINKDLTNKLRENNII